MISELTERSREIFREIVETYFETGEPVGSQTLSQRLALTLSPATIRNVMSDLEDSGLLFAPHTSAGRLPTDRGVRLFVDGLLQVGHLTSDERENIEETCVGDGRSLTEVLNETTDMLSDLTKTASLVVAPKSEAAPESETPKAETKKETPKAETKKEAPKKEAPKKEAPKKEDK